MSDDFDNELYNVYNASGKESGYNDEDLYDDEDLYGEIPVDPNADNGEMNNNNGTNENMDDQQQSSQDDTNKGGQRSQNNGYQQQPQQRRQNQQQQQLQQQMQQYMQQNGMWAGYSPAAYQQYMAAYQRSLQQQMAMNPYQMQQMMQRQYRPNMSPQQPYGQQQNRQNKPRQQQQQTAGDDEAKDKNKDDNTEEKKEESDEGKMFIGGLNWETTDEKLRQYFSQFGEVIDCLIMRDPATQRSRGFAFLTMQDNATVDKILSKEAHYLDGKKIDPKRAIPREEQDKTEKIFVGGISPEVSEEEFRTFFTQFGKVLDATLMVERDTGRPRGFGFVTFESIEGVENALRDPNLAIKDKVIEVKRAMPRHKRERQQMQQGATPVFNPNFRPQGFMPNTGYLGANYNMMNQFANMYGMYGNPAAAGNYNMAAAYYGNAGNAGGYGGAASPSNGGGSSGGSNQNTANNRYQRQQQGESYSRSSRDHHRDRSRERYSSSSHRDHSHSSSGGSGGPIHSSSSTKTQHYRPY